MVSAFGGSNPSLATKNPSPPRLGFSHLAQSSRTLFSRLEKAFFGYLGGLKWRLLPLTSGYHSNQLVASQAVITETIYCLQDLSFLSFDQYMGEVGLRVGTFER